VDLVGNLLRGGSSVGDVELDTEIVVGSTRVVARSQQDTTISLLAPDQSRDSRGGKNRVLTKDNVLDTVTGSELEDDLHGLRGEVSSVTTNNESLAFGSTGHGGQGSLDKVLGVVLLLEDLDSLSQTGGSGLLARVGLSGDGLNVGPEVSFVD
jgi:hypothetical protein